MATVTTPPSPHYLPHSVHMIKRCPHHPSLVLVGHPSWRDLSPALYTPESHRESLLPSIAQFPVLSWTGRLIPYDCPGAEASNPDEVPRPLPSTRSEDPCGPVPIPCSCASGGHLHRRSSPQALSPSSVSVFCPLVPAFYRLDAFA